MRSSMIFSLFLAGLAMAETFGGFGITIQQSAQGVQVVSVIPGTVADGKLNAGDQILSVGDQSLKGISLESATALLRGEVGSYAMLTIQAKDGAINTQNLPRISFRVDELDASKVQQWYAGSAQIGSAEVEAFAEATAQPGYELRGVLQNGRLIEGESLQLQEVKGVYVGQLPPEAPSVNVVVAQGFDLLGFDRKGLTLDLEGSAAGLLQVLDAKGQLVASWNLTEGQTGVQQFAWTDGKAPMSGSYSIRVRQGSMQGTWQATLR